VSETGLPPLWSPAQQSWLQAMGYTVFVDGQVDEVAASAPIELSVAVAPPAPVAVAAAPDATTAAPPRRSAAPGRRTAVRMPDRLQIALLRASGCNPAEPDTQALMAGWNLDELRGNAAAKRALWPQLRALRKRGRA